MQVVIGMSKDKDLDACLGELRAWVDPKNVIIVEADHPRASPVSEMLPLLPGATAVDKGHPLAADQGSVSAGVALAVTAARFDAETATAAAAAPSGDGSGDAGASAAPCPIVVCGSLYIMDDVQKALGVANADADPRSVQQAWSDRKVGLNKDQAAMAAEGDATDRN